MPEWQVALLERLGERVPVLGGRVAAYLADPDGVPSADDFVAHIARELVEVPGAWPAEAVRQWVDFLEAEYGVDDRVDHLIVMRFVEVVVDHGAEVRELQGAKLAVEFERYMLGYVVGGPEDLFVRRLVDALPVFESDDEKPGGFLMDAAMDVRTWFRNGQTGQLTVLFGFLESELGRDPDVDQLIGGYFADLLPEPGDPAEGVLDLLGPKLRALRFQKLCEEDESAPESTVRFLDRMADAVPLLRDRLQEHFLDYRRPPGHAFMGQVVFEVFELYASGRAEDVRPLLEFLEGEFGVDQDVDTVIAVSFVEMLPSLGERGAEIEDALGPRLRGELARQREWSEGRMRGLASARVVPPPDGLDVGGAGEDR
jgi:hypothetical protein